MDRIKRALLIEDEEIDQRQYSRVIQRSNLVDDLCTFSYADDALEYLMTSDDTVDVIFLDINMPRMNGFEFLESLLEMSNEPLGSCIIFMLTTSLNPADKERAMSFKVVKEFINKPLTIEDVQLAAKVVAEARRDKENS